METIILHWLGGGVLGGIGTWLAIHIGPGFLDAIGGAIFKSLWDGIRTKLGFKDKRKKKRRTEDAVTIGKLQKTVQFQGQQIRQNNTEIKALKKDVKSCEGKKNSCERALVEVRTQLLDFARFKYRVEKKMAL